MAAQMVSHTENTSSYTISVQKRPTNQITVAITRNSQPIQANAVMPAFPITSLEVQKKPAIAEVEVGIVSILLHQLKQLRVQDL